PNDPNAKKFPDLYLNDQFRTLYDEYMKNNQKVLLQRVFPTCYLGETPRWPRCFISWNTAALKTVVRRHSYLKIKTQEVSTSLTRYVSTRPQICGWRFYLPVKHGVSPETWPKAAFHTPSVHIAPCRTISSASSSTSSTSALLVAAQSK